MMMLNELALSFMCTHCVVIVGHWWLLRIRSKLRLQNVCINCWWGLNTHLDETTYIVSLLWRIGGTRDLL